jgi:hypothetical protein
MGLPIISAALVTFLWLDDHGGPTYTYWTPSDADVHNDGSDAAIL